MKEKLYIHASGGFKKIVDKTNRPLSGIMFEVDLDTGQVFLEKELLKETKNKLKKIKKDGN